MLNADVVVPTALLKLEAFISFSHFGDVCQAFGAM